MRKKKVIVTPSMRNARELIVHKLNRYGKRITVVVKLSPVYSETADRKAAVRADIKRLMERDAWRPKRYNRIGRGHRNDSYTSDAVVEAKALIKQYSDGPFSVEGNESKLGKVLVRKLKQIARRNGLTLEALDALVKAHGSIGVHHG